MLRLENNDFTELVARKFLELREKLKDNLIEVVAYEESGKIVAYVKERVEIEGVEVKDLRSLIKDKLSGIQGVKITLNGYNLTCYVSSSAPVNVYEEVTVRVYEIEKELGIKLNVNFIWED